MFKEFKAFAMKGNSAHGRGIIIGATFGLIVKSFVDDVIMPPIGMLLGNIDFANLFFVLKEGKVAGPYASVAAAKQAGRGYPELRSVHQHLNQFSDCRCGHLHDGSKHE